MIQTPATRSIRTMLFFQFCFILIYIPVGSNVGDYSKWFLAKSIKCRVPLSQPLSLVCATCNPCHHGDDDVDDDDDDDGDDYDDIGSENGICDQWLTSFFSKIFE